MQSEFNKLCRLYTDREYAGNVLSLNNVSNSQIRDLEIMGEMKEIGTGEKSPNNPYELIESTPELIVCGYNIANCNNYVYKTNNVLTEPITTYNSLMTTKKATSGTNGFFGIVCKVNPSTKYFIKYPTLSFDEIEEDIFKVITCKEYDKKPANDDHNVEYLKSTSLNGDISITTTDNTKYIAICVQIGYAYEGNITISDVMVSLSDVDYKPYGEQRAKMVSRNLYNTVSENYKMLNNINIEDTYLYIVNTANSGDSIMYSNYYYQNKDFFKTNTDYTIVCEVIEADYTGTITISPTSEHGEAVDAHDMFTKTFTINNPKVGVYKMTAKTRESFVNCNYAYRGLVSLYASAVINSLKFRISVIQADDVDLDSFVYEPYKNDYVLNSVGDVADTYNPLTGEYVQRVGKLVLDGSESWIGDHEANGSRRFYIRIQGISVPVGNGTVANICCTHYEKNTANNVSANLQYGCGVSTGGNLSIRDNYTNTDDFKSYLQEQYANGTPVTVYYELAEPVTTIINKVPVLANIPDTTMYIEDNNNLGSIRTVLQTKGQ